MADVVALEAHGRVQTDTKGVAIATNREHDTIGTIKTRTGKSGGVGKKFAGAASGLAVGENGPETEANHDDFRKKPRPRRDVATEPKDAAETAELEEELEMKKAG